MKTTVYRLTVDQYERMIEAGILPESNRYELIRGHIVEKDVKRPEHPTAVIGAKLAIERLLPPGWHARQEAPVRIPGRRSEPEPDVSVARGGLHGLHGRHPGPGDLALIVEVTRTTAAKDRRLAKDYGACGIPAYWIVNLPAARLEVYSSPVGGAYPEPEILKEGDAVELVVDGVAVGTIPVADLLPRQR